MLKECAIHCKNEEGQSIVTVALMSLFVLAILAVVIESGSVYIQRRNLQNTADAAALAGAQELDGTGSGFNDATDVAEDFAASNAKLDVPPVTVPSEGNNAISVEVQADAASVFAGWFGFGSPTVRARATARKSNAQISEGIIPIAVPEEVVGSSSTISISVNVPAAGSPIVGTVRLSPLDPDTQCEERGGNGNGANDLGDGVECGSADGVTLGQILESQNAGGPGQLTKGLANRVANSTNVDGAGTNCLTLDDVFVSRPDGEPWEINPVCAPGSYKSMLVFIPVIDEWVGQGQGNRRATVVDLALFWIEPQDSWKCSGGFCPVVGLWIASVKELLLASGSGQPGGDFEYFKIVQLID